MVLNIYNGAAVISALMKVYIIPCVDKGYINVMLLLQSCADSQHILSGSSSEMFPTSNDGACNFSNTVVEEDIVVIEEGLMARNEDAAVCIKQEEIPEHITFPDIKSEPGEVSNVCVSLLLDPFYLGPEMSVVFVMSVFLFN
jgi:hypothetical protein